MIKYKLQDRLVESFRNAPPIMLGWAMFLTVVAGMSTHLTQGVVVDVPAMFVLGIHNTLPFIYEGFIWSLGDTK